MKYAVLLILLFPILAYGQQLNDSLIAELYNRAMMQSFSGQEKHKDQKRHGYIIIRTPLDSSLLLKEVGRHRFKYYTDRTPAQATCKGDKRDKGRHIYHMYHNILSADTVDMIVGGDIVVYNKPYADFIFTTQALTENRLGRFVYNSITGTWIFYTAVPAGKVR